MSFPRLLLIEALVALRWPGALGAALLVAAGAWGFVLQQGHDELHAAGVRLNRLERRAADVRNGIASAPLSVADRRAQFYGKLPGEADLSQQIERIYTAATAEQLSLEHGEYTGAQLVGTRLVRHRIALPVKGSYAQVQRFVNASLGSVPGLVLDDLGLQRQQVSEPQVDARLQFSLFVVKQ